MADQGKCCDFAARPKQLILDAKREFWALTLGREPYLDASTRSRIVIYSRGKTIRRKITNPERLIPLFDTKRFRVDVVDDIPATLADQARFFSSFAVFLAPNGGWVPNTIFMARDSCIIELHMYVRDSWLVDFGLGASVAEVILVIGDYRDPKKPRTYHKGRVGGDDDFVVTGGKNNLFQGIRRQTQKFNFCKQFLAAG
eukprot:TRINITY_DN45653_c0_g1_i1.p1 TRINITY_DN45653_c0_g1~~TRINITY_DN45653_c0_g1_i1.p1  ORF type:complete len:199 (+),score=5.41 TRINITY_DN45653_c0_g1_i1:308-904(+)